MVTMYRVSHTLDLSPGGPAVNVTMMSDFMAAPPDFFFAGDRRGEVLRHDPQRVNVCARSAKFPGSKGGCLMVTNEDELETTTEILLTLPVFFNVTLERHSKSGDTVLVETDKIAVIVNTQYPHIHDYFTKLLAEAMRLMRRGKRFAVEFDFNRVIEEWMRANYVTAGLDDANPSCWDRGIRAEYYSRHGKVTVTNHGEKVELFACRECIKWKWKLYCWATCTPCCLLACSIYKIQRALLVTDLGGRVQGVVATLYQPDGRRLTTIGANNLSGQARRIRAPDTSHTGHQRAQAPVTQAPQPCVSDALIAAGRQDNPEDNPPTVGLGPTLEPPPLLELAV